MKDLTELQQEFENLIVELDKLKSINQLVSTNEESSRKVVNKISDITTAIFKLKEVVETDFSNKSLVITELIDDLSKLKNETRSDLNKFKNRIFDDNQKISDSITAISRKVEEERAALSKIQNNSNELLNSFKDIKIADRLSSQYSLSQSFKNDFESISKALAAMELTISGMLKNQEKRYLDTITNLKSDINFLESKIEKKAKMQRNFAIVFLVLLFAAIIVPVILKYI